MQVRRLRISGARGFHHARAVDLDLTRPNGSLAGWTVLAGRNGSGKSTFLQAIALAIAGPRATSFIPNIEDWITRGAHRAEIVATISLSSEDNPADQLFLDPVHESRITFTRPQQPTAGTPDSVEPEVKGNGRLPQPVGWFFVGYGAFRHLATSASHRPKRSRLSQQVASLFDETIALADAVDWLVDQHLYELEGRPGAAALLNAALGLLADGLLPDGFQVSRVDSVGLWVCREGAEFPLTVMSDGYRGVTALVLDIVRQMAGCYPDLQLSDRDGTPVLDYPGVVLIDEVEDHLHVGWQKVIGDWLKTHLPQVQFIVTTHSPYVCQSADPGGLILLPGPGENRPPRIVEQDLYERIVYGSGDDALLTELFGVDTPYSAEADRLRQRVGDLEVRVLEGSASPAEREEFRSLSEKLTSSMSARVDEVAARLNRGQ